jgi:hypothetical protein
MTRTVIYGRVFFFDISNNRVLLKYTRQLATWSLEEQFKWVSTVLNTEEGDEDRVDDDDDCGPEVYLGALAAGRGLVGDDKDEHEESE